MNTWPRSSLANLIEWTVLLLIRFVGLGPTLYQNRLHCITTHTRRLWRHLIVKIRFSNWLKTYEVNWTMYRLPFLNNSNEFIVFYKLYNITDIMITVYCEPLLKPTVFFVFILLNFLIFSSIKSSVQTRFYWWNPVISRVL